MLPVSKPIVKAAYYDTILLLWIATVLHSKRFYSQGKLLDARRVTSTSAIFLPWIEQRNIVTSCLPSMLPSDLLLKEIEKIFVACKSTTVNCLV